VFCCGRTTNLGIYRSRKVENIISELNELFFKHKIRHVAFLDENFLTNHNWVKSLSGAIKQSSFHNKMFFSFQTRGDNVNNEILEILFEAGFRTTFIAIETASENLMSVINKGESVKQVLSALENARKQGFVVATNLLFGLPEETQKDRDNAIELLKTLDVDFVKINKAIPFPGTPLNKLAFVQNTLNIENLYENFYSTSILLENPFKNNPFPFLPHGNIEIEIRRDIYKAFFAFYFNWKKIKKTISNIKVGNSFGYSYTYYLRRLPNMFLFGMFMLLNLFIFFFKYIPYKISKVF
jgi:anaerobic magnesium-protoporphyrin IX monomethyl ester cyclase